MAVKASNFAGILKADQARSLSQTCCSPASSFYAGLSALALHVLVDDQFQRSNMELYHLDLFVADLFRLFDQPAKFGGARRHQATNERASLALDVVGNFETASISSFRSPVATSSFA